MAKRIFNKRTIAILLTLVMLFNGLQISASAAGADGGSDARGNWTYAYYLGQEYLGNGEAGEAKPDPVGYGFQGVITSLTFTDDAGVSWTFKWSNEANGEWRITGRGVSKESAAAWPQVSEDKVYIGFCGDKAYTFTLANDGSSESWTYAGAPGNPTHANWFRYIRFIREYIVNVFYQNETGTVVYNGVTYAAQEPLVREFLFKYPNDNTIEDSEYEDVDYAHPVTLMPEDYLTAEMIAQGYEIKYATDGAGNDVLQTGVTISLLGENVLNVYCTLIPPKTENYTVVHKYYTEGSFDGSQPGGNVEVQEGADFAKIVDEIEKKTTYSGNTYGYVSYGVDPEKKVIELTYSRTLPVFGYGVIYNANFGANETSADSENITDTKTNPYTIEVDTNSFIRPNHTFLGWAETPDGEVVYRAGDEVRFTESGTVILYAKWQEDPKYDYSLTYDANFGSNETKADDQNVTGTYATAYGIVVDANSFVRENYTFVGWNTERDGSGKSYAAGNVVSLNAQNNTEILYAQWAEDPKYSYSVIYNANFGANETKTDSENAVNTYRTPYTIDVDANSFIRPNYTFLGWAKAPNGEVVYQAGDDIRFTESGTVTLYAQWVEDPKYAYNLSYNANFGTNEAKADSENVVGTYSASYNITVDANSFVRQNYTFVGWNTEADGSGKSYAANDVVALTAANNTEVLYAQWVENPKYDYSVTYHANFGENETKADAENVMGVYTATYSIAADANTFIRPNYTFTGWNTEADGSGKSYAAGAAVALTAEENTEVLYAQWIENPKYDYSLIYDANFGENEVKADAQNVSGIYQSFYGITVDANEFVRENYTFTGWNTERDGSGTAYAAGSTVELTALNNTEILYAQWTANMHAYTVNYWVRVNEDAYTPFSGDLGDAPVGEQTAFGTVIDKAYLDAKGLPAALTDEQFTYGFSAFEGITVSGEGDVVNVYFTCIVEQPPVEEPPADIVPMSDIPKTGDPVFVYIGTAVASAAGLLGLMLGKKKEETEE